MFMSIEDLGDGPAIFCCGVQTLLVIQGIYRQGVSGFRARYQVVKISIGITRPDLFDDHGFLPNSVFSRIGGYGKDHSA